MSDSRARFEKWALEHGLVCEKEFAFAVWQAAERDFAERVAQLEKALSDLKAEISGWITLERAELVNLLSFTNVRVMENRIEQAERALAAGQTEVNESDEKEPPNNPLDNECKPNDVQTLANILVGAAKILDVVKQEWAESWSEWDQSIRDGISKELRAIYGEPRTKGQTEEAKKP